MKYCIIIKKIYLSTIFNIILGGTSCLLLFMGFIKYCILMSGIDNTIVLSDKTLKAMMAVYQHTQGLNILWKLSPDIILFEEGISTGEWISINIWAILLLIIIVISLYIICNKIFKKLYTK